MPTYRKERVSDLLLAFLAEEIRKFRDPRLEFVTVTGLDLSRDLKSARVYWAMPPLPEQTAAEPDEAPPQMTDRAQSRKQEAATALQGAESFLKKRIAEELDLRYVPKLVFKHDDSSETGSRIDDLLKKAGF
jgi:ribosome-binding factor A